MNAKARTKIMNATVSGVGTTTLVLAHGFGTSRHVWDDVLPLLSKKYRVVVFDWSFSSALEQNPTSGDLAPPLDLTKYSSFSAFADDLLGLADDMELKGAAFVGHSMSGMIGCIASAARPEIFSHLILIGSSPRYLNGDDYLGGFERADIDAIFAAIENDFTFWGSGFAKLVVCDKYPDAVDKFKGMLKGMNPSIALELAKTVFLSDNREVLEKVTVPCTIIQSDTDVVVPRPAAEYMLAKIKGPAALEIIGTDGHFPQLTVPDLLVEIIDRAVNPPNTVTLIKKETRCCIPSF